MRKKPSDAAIAAWTSLVRAEQTVLASVESDLKQRGLPPLSWYDVLLEVSRSEEGCLRPNEIERRTLLPQYNVSRLVDRLERAGFLERQPCPEDGRGSLLRATDSGRTLLRSMWPAYADAIERHVGSRLSGQEAKDLARLLKKLTGKGH